VVVFEKDDFSFSEALCPIDRLEFTEMTIENSGTLEIDSGCPDVPDWSEECRTLHIPTNVVRDGYLEDYPVLSFKFEIFD
jgi:hypothetical protein